VTDMTHSYKVVAYTITIK